MLLIKDIKHKLELSKVIYLGKVSAICSVSLKSIEEEQNIHNTVSPTGAKSIEDVTILDRPSMFTANVLN